MSVRRVGQVFAVLATGSSLLAPRGLAAQERDTLRLDLASVVRLAAENSAAVEVERQALIEAEARVTEQRSELLPQIGVDATQGRRTFNTASFGIDFPTAPGSPPLFDPNGQVLGPVATVDLRAHLGQTLFDWSQVERVRAARASVEASRVRTEGAEARAAFAAAAAFVQAVRASGRLAAKEQDLTLARDLLGAAKELLASGVGVRLDVTRAEAQLAGVQADLVAARSTAERSRLALLRTLSLPLDTPVQLTASSGGTVTPDDPGAAVTLALAHRAELQEIEERITAAELDVRAVRAERLPTLAFGLGQGLNGRTYGHLLNTYEWTFRVSVPVFEGMRGRAREEEEEAQVAALEARRREITEQIEFEVRDALILLTSARELVVAADARLRLAEAELDQARERFQSGVAGSTDVFSASLRVSDARTAQVDARASLEAARVALATAEGAVEELR